mgnify:CR=1 FL=1|tara:strand:+ start:2267 stop:3487 length:1221 start_codon:yes stop_codon:yes gene_type:complete
MSTTEDLLRDIMQLSLSSSPEQMLEKALTACITIAGARGGSILAEEGPYMQFLFADVPDLVGVRVPHDSIAGSSAADNLVIYTYAPYDKRHFKGVDDQIEVPTRHLLSIPIPSIHRSVDDERTINSAVLQLLFDHNIMVELDAEQGPHEFDVADFRRDPACEQHFSDLFWILPNIALGLEVMKLRQTSYQAIHELKNKMIGALSWCHYLKDDLAERDAALLEDESISEDLALTESTIREGAELAKTYLQFTTIYSPQFAPGDVNDVLRHTAASARVLARETGDHAIDVQEEFGDGLPVRTIDAEQLKMAFFNLCKNAVEAMIEHCVADAVLRLSSAVGPTGVTITISDSGPGMPEEIADNLFIAFKTKKEGGTGLGLTITKKIIDVHGGQIRCATGTEGTTFVVTL